MATKDPPIGALVEVQAGRGLVRFCGLTDFAPGKWIGIELFEPKGKNDGTLQGRTYWASCKPNHGVFVRPSQVKVVTTEANGRTVGHQRTASSALARSSAARPGPSPAPRAETPLSKTGGASTVTGRSPPAPVRLTSPTKRAPSRDTASAMAPPPPPAAAPPPVSVPQSPHPMKEPAAAPLSQLQIPPTPSAATLPSSPVISAVSSSPGPITARPLPAESPQISRSEEQELRAKFRILEAKRADDVQRIRELESRLADAESFVSLRPKLQAKLTALQTELLETRRALADQNAQTDLSEGRLLESGEQLEMAMLDKEVAEERAEAAEAEAEGLRERLAIVEVEIKVMKEAAASDAADTNDPARSSLAFMQLEKHNERLKEALIRLRDISHETENEQRRKIQELERDLASVDDLQSQYENTLSKLANADVQIEDLKAQLDDALGAEEMLVQLTERNLMMSEKIEEMRIVIEDLEALKELNDELEENHVETEKALQEEIDSKDIAVRDQTRKIESLEDSLHDYENTIGQFRELVLQLQHDLEALRAQNQNVQNESATHASQTAAMMSLNLKLQSSAVKNQVKTIDLELRRIEAREGRELLNIVQPYLPQVYIESDSDATNLYLFFQRIAAKADIINNIVGQNHGLPESLNGEVSENLALVCEMRQKLALMSGLCKRFAAVLRRCSVDDFLKLGIEYVEVAPVEKRVDMHIDLLKRDEFRENECGVDVNKWLSQMHALDDKKKFGKFDVDLGERQLLLATSFDNELDFFAAGVGLTMTCVQTFIKEDDAEVEYAALDPEVVLFAPLQALLDQYRSVKAMARKLVKRVEDLTMESSALRPQLMPKLQALTGLLSKAGDFSGALGMRVSGHINELRSSKNPLKIPTILSITREQAGELHVGQETVASWEAIVGDIMRRLVKETAALLPLTMESENVVKVAGPAPWIVHVDEIRAAAAVNVDAERKVSQLGEELQELARGIRARDQSIQESSVKIEFMERRLEGVKRQGDTIVELEADLAKARKQERTLQEALEQLQTDLDSLEKENMKLRQSMPSPEKQAAASAQPTEGESVALDGNFETSHLLELVDSLRGTVRYLRSENSHLKGQNLLKEIQQLPPLPAFTRSLATPPQSPSRSHSKDDSSEPDEPPRRPTLRTLAMETKHLYRDVIAFSSTPRVVDLSALNKQKAEGKPAWIRMKETPAYQILERKKAAEQLNRKVKALLERAETVGVAA